MPSSLASGERPFLLVIAGPNGSGKSSLTNHLRRQGYDFGFYVNPDEIAAELDGPYEDRVRRAQAIADNRRSEVLLARRSFSFETVFSHPSKLDVLTQARQLGFSTTLFFVSVDDPQISVERVRTRVGLGGHDVPADRIVARYRRTMEMLPDIVACVDRALILDNSERLPVSDSFRIRLVATTRAVEPTQVAINTRQPLPAWASRYLIEPARRRGWAVSA